jgi:hypothetical protein
VPRPRDRPTGRHERFVRSRTDVARRVGPCSPPAARRGYDGVADDRRRP